MKHLFLSILVSFLIFNSTNAQEWSKYRYEDLEFVADFLSTPERTIQKVPTDLGDIDMHMLMHTPESDINAVYSVIRSDYPKEQFIDATDEYNDIVLDGAVKGAVSNTKGELVFDKKINFNGFPGRNIKIKIEGAYIYIKTYLVINTLYITQVICYTANDNNLRIKRFMDSFEIIKTK